MSQSKLFVGNLDFATTEDQLSELFSQFGGISELKLITDRETGRSRGFAFITFDDAQTAEQAMELNGSEFGGRRIKVNLAEDDSRGGGRGGRGGSRDRR